MDHHEATEGEEDDDGEEKEAEKSERICFWECVKVPYQR